MTPSQTIASLSSQYSVVTTVVTLVGGAAAIVAKANPQRWAIIIASSSGGGIIMVIPNGTAATNIGYPVNGQNMLPLSFTQADFPALPSASWSAFSAIGGNVTVTEIILAV